MNDIQPVGSYSSSAPSARTIGNRAGAFTEMNYSHSKTEFDALIYSSEKNGRSEFEAVVRFSYEHTEARIAQALETPQLHQSQAYPQLDLSPEAVAGRIMSFVGSLFSGYQDQHSDMEHDAMVDQFVEEVRKGFEQGFKDAKSIIEALGRMNDEVESAINETRDIFYKMLEEFTADQKQGGESKPSAPEKDLPELH